MKNTITLYDLSRPNDFYCAILYLTQKVNDTYFRNRGKSYNDQAFVSVYALSKVGECRIVSDEIKCVSEHFSNEY